jgi:integrase/recombinase XerD
MNRKSLSFKDYLLGSNLAEVTEETYNREMGTLLREVLSIHNPISKKTKISKDDVRKMKVYLNRKENGKRVLHKNTLITYYSAIKQFLKYLDKDTEWGYRWITDSLRNEPQEIQDKSGLLLTDEEMLKLFNCKDVSLRDKAIIHTLGYTGIRNNELRTLNISDVNFTEGTITNVIKGGRTYTRDIHPEALQSIKDYIEHGRRVKQNLTRDKRIRENQDRFEKRRKDIQNALFLSKDGSRRVTKIDISRLLKETAIKCNIKKRIYPHLLRASFITLMHNRGYSLTQIIQQTGHREPKTLTNFYIHPSKEQKKQTYLSFWNDIKERKEEEEVKPTVIKEKPKPEIDKVKELKLQLKLKEKELELAKLKSQNHDNNMYG